jgi:hypothetical protein
MMKRRLHRSTMLHMYRFFIGEQAFAKDFAHPVKTHSLNEVMLFRDGDFISTLRREDSDKELTGEKERADIAMSNPHTF